MACDAATDILARYISIRENLPARSPANVDALRAAIGEQSASHLLAPWSEEMMAAIADQDFRPWIRGDILLMVDFPADLQEERKIRAKMHIEETSLTFPWAEANSTGHYELGAEVEDKVFLKREQRLELELVQDRGWFSRKRSFSGNTQFDVLKALAEGSGLTPKMMISLNITSDDAQQPVPRVVVDLNLDGAVLPDRQIPEFCKQ